MNGQQKSLSLRKTRRSPRARGESRHPSRCSVPANLFTKKTKKWRWKATRWQRQLEAPMATMMPRTSIDFNNQTWLACPSLKHNYRKYNTWSVEELGKNHSCDVICQILSQGLSVDHIQWISVQIPYKITPYWNVFGEESSLNLLICRCYRYLWVASRNPAQGFIGRHRSERGRQEKGASQAFVFW